MSWECGRVVGAGGAMCCAYNIVMEVARSECGGRRGSLLNPARHNWKAPRIQSKGNILRSVQSDRIYFFY